MSTNYIPFIKPFMDNAKKGALFVLAP